MSYKEERIRELNEKIAFLQEILKKVEEMDDNSIDFTLSIDDFPDFPWNYRLKYAFEKAHIETVYDLINYSPKKLMKSPGIGPKTIERIEEWMSIYDIKFLNS